AGSTSLLASVARMTTTVTRTGSSSVGQQSTSNSGAIAEDMSHLGLAAKIIGTSPGAVVIFGPPGGQSGLGSTTSKNTSSTEASTSTSGSGCRPTSRQPLRVFGTRSRITSSSSAMGSTANPATGTDFCAWTNSRGAGASSGGAFTGRFLTVSTG